MKILKLTFENLNSLMGGWEIDFTKADYLNEGIFAITGPTGSGKSTILDAICLALYARTPRLTSINKSNNEIISKQAHFCSASLTFETVHGLFCCTWHQRRSHHKKEGALIDSTHEISDPITKKIIENKKKEVLNTVERVTGMDFKRFTRSMMLAQGGFAAFLQANSDERAPILEQITGTDIYSELSILTHKINKEEQGKLELLNATINGLSLLNEAEHFELTEALTLKQTLEHQIDAQYLKVSEASGWRQRITLKETELTQTELKLKRLSETKISIDPLTIQLKRAQDASQIDKEFTLLSVWRKQFQQNKNELFKNEQERPKKIAIQQQVDLELIEREREVKKLRESLFDEQIIIKEVILLDQALKQINKDLNEKHEENQKVKSSLLSRQTEHQKLYHAMNQQDIAQLTLQYQKGQLARDQLLSGRLLREYQTEREQLLQERSYVNKIISLEQERKQLQKGLPCPLCGSYEHPLAEGQIPEISEIDLKLEDLNRLLKEIEVIDQKLIQIEKQKQKIEIQILQQQADLKQLQGGIEGLIERQELLEQQIETLEKKQQLTQDERIKRYGKKDIVEEEMRLQNELEDQDKQLNRLKGEQQKRLIEFTQLNTEHKRLISEIEKTDALLAENESHFIQSYQEKGFISEEAFKSALLSVAEQEKIQQKIQKYEEENRFYLAQKESQTKQLSDLIQEKLTEQSLEQLLEQKEQLYLELKNIRESLGAIKQKLNDDAHAKVQWQQQQSIIEQQQKQVNRWQRLHQLIGSADGKKYRNFAQGITFDLLISHANRQLETMSDRYLLIRDQTQPLELNVIDNYQAGEVRSTKNLSGGESFIISLSLALGLSKMGSKKVQVDSLFLDEGFGTLDENALSLALDSLSRLHQDGKLIGVISHVLALKESIQTQITVQPILGGHSEIYGPGCRRL